MPVKKEQSTPTTTKLTIQAEPAALRDIKNEVLKRLARQMKIPGFRPGKVPLELVEKQANQSTLQAEFLDDAINRLYNQAVESEKLRPVAQPKVNLVKFVPFTTLEFTAEVEAIGSVTLPDYTKMKATKKPVTITEKEVDEVIATLQERLADKAAVDRPAKNGDQLTINFAGKDAATNEPIKGADGREYPLVLGSNTFIPGFETNLVGLKPGEEKTFTLTFPKDYGVAALQNRKVAFTVTVVNVQEMTKPKADDTFASKAGPFKTLKELRADIKKQLTSEKQAEADRDFEDELLEKVAARATVALPPVLIDEEVGRLEQQARQNATYRGRTWTEYLQDLGQTEDDYRASLRGTAERRVKAGLVLSEIADQENITVTPQEFELRLQVLRNQHSDPAMRAELEKPENQRAILSRMLSEKTLARLTSSIQRPSAPSK